MRRTVRLVRSLTHGTVTLAVVALAAAGCGTNGPGARNGIQVWALQDSQNEPVIRAGIDAFNPSSPIKAELSTYVNDAYKQKLQVSMGSPNAPDIFFNWGGGNLAQFVRANQVVDLTDALRGNRNVADAFLPNVLDVGKVDDRQYGLPMNGIQPVILFYHKRVFAEANVEPPKTYDDLLTLVETFKARKVVPLALPGSQGWTELMYLEYLLDRVGGPARFTAIAGGRDNAWRHPDVLTALRMCQDLARRGAFGANFASVNYDNSGASKLFATGRAAMFLMGSWEYLNQMTHNPDFIRRGELGWVAFPAVPGGAGDPKNVVGNPSNYFSVAAGSPDRDAAVRFLMTTLTSDGYVTGLINAGQVPAIKGVEKRLKGVRNADFSSFTYGLVADAPIFTQSWDQALTPSVGAELLTNLQKLFLSDISPEQFVAAMEKAR